MMMSAFASGNTAVDAASFSRQPDDHDCSLAELTADAQLTVVLRD